MAELIRLQSINFICEPCRDQADNPQHYSDPDYPHKEGHAACRGGTWCACQHRSDKR